MTTRLPIRRIGALVAVLLASMSASAHTIVGDRLFPATLTVDDPGVNDELALPTFSYLTAANFDGTAGPSSFTFGGEFQKTITADLAISIGSEGVTFQRNPRATGFANIETGLKYVFYQNPGREFIVSGGVGVELGGTGSPASSALPSDPFTTVTPSLYVGKGLGDASADWLKPFAVTGQASVSIPTTGRNADGSQNPTFVTYGGSVQYSLLYRNAFVQEVPSVFRNLVPAFEGVFSTPVANTGPSDPDDFSVHTTTGVVGPSLYYIGTYFEIGVMAQVPINRASGHHPGALAIIDFFLDDIAPNSIGKPCSARRKPAVQPIEDLMTTLFKRAGVAFALAFVPGAASAHAFLDHAVPAVGATVSTAPGDLELDFTQKIVASLSGVRVASASGSAVATAKATADAGNADVLHVHLTKALPPGVYVVTWHVVSVDTHPTSDPTSSPSRHDRRGARHLNEEGRRIDLVFDALVAARWVHFAAVSLIFGGGLLCLAIGAEPTEAARRTRHLLRAAAIAAALSGCAWLAATIANVGGGPGALVDADMLALFFRDTPFGGPALVRLALLAVLVAVAMAPGTRRASVGAEVVLAAMLLVSQAWLGHAAEGGASTLGLVMIGVYAVHVLAAAAWIGGLAPLAFVLRETRGHADPAADLLLRTYSAMAMVAVALVVASGVANTSFHLGLSVTSLMTTPYGHVLAMKLLLVLAMLVLAACNRFVIMPRWFAGDGRTGWIEATVTIEIGLAVLVLGAAAILGLSPPAI